MNHSLNRSCCGKGFATEKNSGCLRNVGNQKSCGCAQNYGNRLSSCNEAIAAEKNSVCPRSPWNRRICGCADNVTPQPFSCRNANHSGNASFQNGCDTTWRNRDLRCADAATPRTQCHRCAQGAPYSACLSDKSLAMVYSPHQKFENLYDPRQGLCNGTVFCDLNKPFLGGGR